MTFPLVFYLGFKYSVGIRFLLRQFAFSFLGIAYFFAPSLFLRCRSFAVCKLFQHPTVCFYAYTCNWLSNDWIRWAFRVFTFIGCSSLCLYNSNKYCVIQVGNLYKLTKMNLCKIQICADCGRMMLTVPACCDRINMLGRSADRPNFL